MTIHSCRTHIIDLPSQAPHHPRRYALLYNSNILFATGIAALILFMAVKRQYGLL